MPYIDIVPESEAEGPLKEVYDEIVRQRGRLSQVLMVQSLNPESIRRHLDLYMTVMFGKSPLRRVQREMMAVVVSLANNCPYCVAHHSSALHHFWKDREKLEQFRADWRTVITDRKDQLLCEFAETLTLSPGRTDTALADRMKAAGLTDRVVLDAALVVSYFNFVNRMVLGLGVEEEGDGGEGYRYD